MLSRISTMFSPNEIVLNCFCICMRSEYLLSHSLRLPHQSPIHPSTIPSPSLSFVCVSVWLCVWATFYSKTTISIKCDVDVRSYIPRCHSMSFVMLRAQRSNQPGTQYVRRTVPDTLTQHTFIQSVLYAICNFDTNAYAIVISNFTAEKTCKRHIDVATCLHSLSVPTPTYTMMGNALTRIYLCIQYSLSLSFSLALVRLSRHFRSLSHSFFVFPQKSSNVAIYRDRFFSCLLHLLEYFLSTSTSHVIMARLILLSTLTRIDCILTSYFIIRYIE